MWRIGMLEAQVLNGQSVVEKLFQGPYTDFDVSIDKTCGHFLVTRFGLNPRRNHWLIGNQ
jgi:hypothetical protein